MLFKDIEIRNFQTIKELNVTLEEGKCYHIKGDNNVGKSAFLKSLQAIVRNFPTRNLDEYKRNGADSLSVQITDFDGNTVKLSRGAEDFYSWTIDGVSGRVDKTGGNVPDVVKAYFNFYEEMEKSKEIINIRPARSRLLFIDTTFAENYYLLQKALGIGEFLAAIKIGMKEKNELKKLVDSLSSKIEGATDSIDGVIDYSIYLSELDTYEKAMDLYFTEIELIENYLEMDKKIQEKEQLISSSQIDFDNEQVKNTVETIKQVHAYIELEKTIREKENALATKMTVLKEHEKTVATIETIKQLQEQQKVLVAAEKLEEQVDTLNTSIALKQDALDTYNEHTPSNLKTIIQQLRTYSEKAQEIEKRDNELKALLELEDTKEQERKAFMVENKFCPVVMATKDKLCPVNGQSMEELLK